MNCRNHQFFHVSAALPPPQNLKAEDVDERAATIFWDEIGGETSFMHFNTAPLRDLAET